MTVQSGSRGGGVFAQLDNQEVGSLYIYLAVLATIGGFLFGFDSANIGSALVFLPFKLGPVGTGIVVAGGGVRPLFGGGAAGPPGAPLLPPGPPRGGPGGVAPRPPRSPP